jgi:predicted transcriptional regulator
MSTPKAQIKTSKPPATLAPKKIEKIETKTKTEIRNATAQAGKLLRGIDNNVASFLRLRDQINAKVTDIQRSAARTQTLLMGISNAALQPEVKPAVSRAVLKPATKPATKPAKSVAPKEKPESEKPEKKTIKVKPETKKTSNRPELRQVINQALETGDKTAAAIYHVATEIATKDGFSVWSRQSLYNLLDKAVGKGEISKTGDGAGAIYSRLLQSNDTADEEAERLLQRVENDTNTAQAV